MQKQLLILALIFSIFTSSVRAEMRRDSGYSIQIKLANYSNDTLFLGFQLGSQAYKKDSAFLDKESGSFIFKGTKNLEPGAYILILKPTNDFIQILVNEREQKFYYHTDVKEKYTHAKTNSADNSAFLKYMNYLTEKHKEAEKLNAEKTLESLKKVEAIAKDVKNFQEKIITDNPNTITALIVKSALEPPYKTYPEIKDSTERRLKEFYFFKNHYFDNFEMSNPAILRTPLLDNQIETCFEKLTVPVPDSIIESMDRILYLFRDNKEAFQHYYINFLNKYLNSNYVGYDAIPVHLTLKYMATGLTDGFIDKDYREKRIDDARKKEPTLIGKRAPNLKTFLENGKTSELYDVKAKFTILFFYAFDCPHCQKQSPDLVDYFKKAKSQGIDLKIVTVHTKLGESNIEPGWKYMKEKKFDDFINTNDPFSVSRYHTLFDIESTPRLFVLDENKIIRSKGIEAKQLEEVINAIVKEDEERKSKK